MGEIVEEIDKRRKTSFTVSSIPVSLLKDFKKFCKEECGDIYWVGIKVLLERKNITERLQEQINSLQEQILELKKTKREVKTFG